MVSDPVSVPASSDAPGHDFSEKAVDLLFALLRWGIAVAARDAAPYALRFQLEPGVQASLARDRRSILLRGHSGRGWWFRSDGPDGIACWFIDTDYNEESFFVRHAYFLGASDPYKSLKTTLKAEINAEAWESLNSDTSRPFGKPGSGRIAVKVINHLGDEVMKVFKI